MTLASVRLDGFDDLLADLRAMRPRELAEASAEVVDHAVEVAAASLIQAYPQGETGGLRKGVKKSVRQTSTGVVGTVKSTAPHAHLWEFGTQSRRTRQGWHRGVMPSQYNEGLVGIAMRGRRQMRPKLIAVLTAKGLVVTDDGG